VTLFNGVRHEYRMPWKVIDTMSQRLKFVNFIMDGARMTDACRAFGVSRKTGYKIWNRYLECGVEAFIDRSRRPQSSPQKTTERVVELLVEWRKSHPTWGPKKIRCEIAKKKPGLRLPAVSSIGDILARKHLVKPRKRRRRASPSESPLRESVAPNDLWCADFKGQFLLQDQTYCYPLTITDHFSRYCLTCDAQENTQGMPARAVFEEAFREYGLPAAIRVDNGSPFASTGLLGLTLLSVWWMRLGIAVERIEPGHPEQNGRHERFHRTLKEEATRPSAKNILRQQELFDRFRQGYNESRPHESIQMKYPAEVYSASTRIYPEQLEDMEYPLHDITRKVHPSGEISFEHKKYYLSQALAGEKIGLRETHNGLWLVNFMNIDLGHIDPKTTKVLPMSPV
jgi:transposase InsO family protein